MTNGDCQGVDQERLHLYTVCFDNVRVVLVKMYEEHFIVRVFKDGLGRGHTGQGRHVDDTNLVCLAGFERERCQIIDTFTLHQVVVGMGVAIILGDVYKSGF